MAASCSFCEREFDKDARRGNTGEHVFPDWAQPYLKSPAGPGTQTHWEASRSGREVTREYPAYPAQQVVKGVCRECNNDWLSPIEDVVKPYLLPLLEGKRRLLGETAQEALSLWAYKTALVIGLLGGEGQHPQEVRREFFARGELPSTTRIWITSADQRELTYIDRRSIKVRASPDDEPPAAANCFSVLLAVGYAVFYVLSWSGPKPDMGPIYARFGGIVSPIAPSRGPAKWPPGQPLSVDGLDDLAEVFATWDNDRACHAS